MSDVYEFEEEEEDFLFDPDEAGDVTATSKARLEEIMQDVRGERDCDASMDSDFKLGDVYEFEDEEEDDFCFDPDEDEDATTPQKARLADILQDVRGDRDSDASMDSDFVCYHDDDEDNDDGGGGDDNRETITKKKLEETPVHCDNLAKLRNMGTKSVYFAALHNSMMKARINETDALGLDVNNKASDGRIQEPINDIRDNENEFSNDVQATSAHDAENTKSNEIDLSSCNGIAFCSDTIIFKDIETDINDDTTSDSNMQGERESNPDITDMKNSDTDIKHEKGMGVDIMDDEDMGRAIEEEEESRMSADVKDKEKSDEDTKDEKDSDINTKDAKERSANTKDEKESGINIKYAKERSAATNDEKESDEDTKDEEESGINIKYTKDSIADAKDEKKTSASNKNGEEASADIKGGEENGANSKADKECSPTIKDGTESYADGKDNKEVGGDIKKEEDRDGDSTDDEEGLADVDDDEHSEISCHASEDARQTPPEPVDKYEEPGNTDGELSEGDDAGVCGCFNMFTRATKKPKRGRSTKRRGRFTRILQALGLVRKDET